MRLSPNLESAEPTMALSRLFLVVVAKCTAAALLRLLSFQSYFVCSFLLVTLKTGLTKKLIFDLRRNIKKKLSFALIIHLIIMARAV